MFRIWGMLALVVMAVVVAVIPSGPAVSQTSVRRNGRSPTVIDAAMNPCRYFTEGAPRVRLFMERLQLPFAPCSQGGGVAAAIGGLMLSVRASGPQPFGGKRARLAEGGMLIRPPPMGSGLIWAA